MKKNTIARLKSSFDALQQTTEGSDVEFWFARELMPLLGYNRWENFSKVIQKAITACKNVGAPVDNHFRGVTKMVSIGSGAERAIDDIVQNNTSVRSMLGERGIKPEELPPEEDLKKLERRVKSSEKKMIKSSELPTESKGRGASE